MHKTNKNERIQRVAAKLVHMITTTSCRGTNAVPVLAYVCMHA